MKDPITRALAFGSAAVAASKVPSSPNKGSSDASGSAYPSKSVSKSVFKDDPDTYMLTLFTAACAALPTQPYAFSQTQTTNLVVAGGGAREKCTYSTLV
jgi:hypothetical protein